MIYNFFKKNIIPNSFISEFDIDNILLKFLPKSKLTIKFFCLIFLILQSCVPNLPTIKNPPSEDIEVPEDFTKQESCHLQNCDSNEIELLSQKNWQLFFQDKNLINLIELALENNQEIKILEQEIMIANNEFEARKGEYLPKFGIGAKYEYEKIGELTSQGQSDLANGVSDKLNNHQIGINTSWEVDIWQKLRNSAKSSYNQYLASVEGKNYAKTRLVSEVAINYYELLALDKKLAIIEEFIENLKKVKEVLELQQIAARSNSLAVKRFSAELAKNESQKFAILREIKISENNLNRLLGRLPQKIYRSQQNFSISQLADFKTGIPSDLLNNRPDVKEASLKIKAAKLNLKSVKAKFYPSFSIDGNVGYQAFNSSHLIESPTSVFYNLAGGITAPILNRKAIKADYFSANNKQIQAVYDYEKTFIKAYGEVANQLTSLQNLIKINQLKTQQVNELHDAVDIANMLFKAARIEYLESLLTKREYLIAQIELVEVKQQQIASLIILYKALGGGWKEKIQS